MPHAHPPEKWTKEGLTLVRAIRNAGGGVLRADGGMLQVFGPMGIAVVAEPGTVGELEPASIEIVMATGLKIGKEGT